MQTQAAKIYTEVPALIHLAGNEQEDTNGFNLVEHLPSFIYSAINDGKIRLWDSPKKLIVITPQALQNLEKSNSVSFSRTGHLFLNELWTGSRRKTEFAIVGISFLSESPKGKISFGYIDLAEASALLSKSLIPCNVNGPAQITYMEALYSRRYQFNLLQFGSNDFASNPLQSVIIRNEAFYSKKRVTGLFVPPQTKMLTYVIEKSVGQAYDPGADCLGSIEKYLNENKEVLFNIGGDRYFDYQNSLFDITVTRIEVTEIWTKKDDLITYTPQTVRIFANNKPLRTITFEEIAKWKLLIGFKTLEDILREKVFAYSIYKINRDLIPYEESGLYLKALLDYKWTQVSTYVKYSRN